MNKNQDKSNTHQVKSTTGRKAQRTDSLYIISVLKNYSDENHPMTIKQIQEKIKDDFLNRDEEKAPDRTTLMRQLDAIISIMGADSTVDDYGNELDDSLKMGFYIGRYIKKDGEYLKYDPDNDLTEKKNTRTETQYYYYKSIFDETEVRMLIDSLETHNYISAEDISELVVKISGLAPASMKAYRNKDYSQANDPRVDYDNSLLRDNLKVLTDIIKNHDFALIKKGYYGTDHRLVVPDSDSSLVRPLRLMFNNGYYYLIAVQYSTKNKEYFIVHYRIDRLGYIEPHKPTKQELKAYSAEEPGDAASYRLHHPVMFGDNMVKAKIHVSNSPYMLNTLYDFFGTAATITELSDELLELKVTATFGGLHLFATEYCADVQVISPQDLADIVKEDLTKGLVKYPSDPEPNRLKGLLS